MQLEIELTSLQKETDDSSAQRREAIERELAELRERSDAMKAQWQAEKQAIQGIREKKARLEEARTEADRAERAADLQRAAELRYGEIPELEKELAALEGGEDGPRDGKATPSEATAAADEQLTDEQGAAVNALADALNSDDPRARLFERPRDEGEEEL
jgi:ATP-dependent Clp protease ATP-binding subunit ClpB